MTDATPSATRHTPSLADTYAPEPQVLQARHLIVRADTGRTYDALRRLDLTDVRGPLVTAAFRVRDLPQWWRERRHGGSRTPTRMTVDDLVAESEWVLLGETQGEELALGVAGVFWKPVVRWRQVEPAEFAEFAEPGLGKIVMSLSVRPYGLRSLVSYDTRVTTTDRGSAARFARYWRTVRPFVGAIQKSTLRTIAAVAERAGAPHP
ncbi:hypothetical protein [Saccharomonospora xinjiangensis]|uniref:Polyketide cyclase / dehydrase and lipid transport n=1 Tax=Saccharomonospora xinjiangensis XJ-54 TaxID=882086 RepID=I0V7M6_9PSEU|nr:hypothetical protein [Saccharomonospora xinjiangensis]EID56129.1 hypothetical protein SacxiDRAFT_3938 [Saccharomonospora xinjiangensis XJ-54]